MLEKSESDMSQTLVCLQHKEVALSSQCEHLQMLCSEQSASLQSLECVRKDVENQLEEEHNHFISAQERCKSLELELVQNKMELVELQDTLQHLQSDKQNSNSKVEELNDQILALTSNLTEQTNRMTELTNDLANKNQELEELRLELCRLQEKLQHSEEHVLQLSSSLDKATQQYETVNSDLLVLTLSLQENKTELEKSQHSVDSLKTLLEEKSLEVSQLVCQLEKSQHSVDSLKTLLEEKSLEVSQLVCQLEKVCTEKHEMTSQHTALTQELHTNNTLVQEQTELFDGISQQLQETQQELDLKNKYINELKRSVEEQESHVKTFNEQFEDLVRVYLEMKDKCSALLAVSDDVIISTDSSSLESTFQTVVAKVNDLFQNLSAELNQTRRELLSKKDEMTLLCVALQENSSQLLMLQNELASVLSVLSCFKHDSVHQSNNLKETIVELSQQIDSYQSSLQDKDVCIQNYCDEIHLWQVKVGDLQSSLVELTSSHEQQMQALKDSNSSLENNLLTLTESYKNEMNSTQAILLEKEIELKELNQMRNTLLLGEEHWKEQCMKVNEEVKDLVTQCNNQAQELQLSVSLKEEMEVRVKNLVSRVECLEIELKDLVEANGLLKEEKDHLGQLLDDKSEELLSLQSRVSELNSQVKCLQEDNLAQQKEITSCQAQYRNNSQDLNLLSEKYKALEQEHRLVVNQVEEIQYTARTWEQELCALQMSCDETVSIQSVVQTVSTQVTSNTSQDILSSLPRVTSNTSQDILSSLQHIVSTFRRQIDKLKSDDHLKEQEIDQLKTELNEVKETVNIDRAASVEEMAGLQFELDKSLELLKKKDGEIQSLQEKLLSISSSSHEEVQQLASTADHYKNQLTECGHQITELTSIMSELNSTLKEEKAQKEELALRLSQTESTLEDTAHQLDAVTSQKLNLEKEQMSLAQKLTKLEEDLQGSLSDRKHLCHQIECLQSDLELSKTATADLTASNAKQQEVISELRASLTLANAETAGFEEALEAANKTIYSLESDNAQQQRYLDHLQTMLDKFQQEMKETVESLQLNSADKTQQISALETQLSVKMTVIKELETQLEEKHSLLTQLENKVEEEHIAKQEYQTKIMLLEAHVDEMRSHNENITLQSQQVNENLFQQVQQLELQLKNTQVELERKQESLISLETAYQQNTEHSNANMKRLESELLESKTSLDKYINKESENESRMKELHQELEKTLEEKNLLVVKCIDTESRLVQLLEQVADLHDKQQTLNTERDCLKSSCDQRQVSLETLKTQLNYETERLSELEKIKLSSEERIQLLLAEKDIISQQCLSQEERIQSLLAEKDTISQQCLSQEERIQSLLAEKDIISQQCLSQEERIQSLLAEKDTISQQCLSQEERIQSLLTEKDMISQQCLSQEERIQSLLAEKDKKSDEEAIETGELTSRLDLLSSQLDLKECEVEHLTQENQELTVSLNALQSQVSALSEEKKQVEDEKRVISESMQNAALVLRYQLESVSEDKEKLQLESQTVLQTLRHDNTSLQTQVTALNQTVSELAVQLEETKEESMTKLQELQTTKAQVEDKNKLLSEELNQHESKIQELEATCSELNDKLTMSSVKLKQVTSHLQDTITQLRSFVTEQSAIITVLQEDSMKQQDTEHSLLAIAASSNKVILEGRKSLNSLSQELEMLKQHSSFFYSENQSLELQLAEAKEMVQIVAEEKSRIKKELEDSISELYEAYDKSEKKLVEKEELFRALQAELHSKLEMLKERDDHLTEVTEKLTSLKEDFDQLNLDRDKELRLEESTKASLQKDLVELEEKCTQLELSLATNVKEFEKQLMESQERIAHLEQDLRIASSKLEQSILENEINKSEISSLHLEIETKLQESFKLHADLSSCQQELKQSQLLLEGVKSDCKQVEDENQEKLNKLAEEIKMSQETVQQFALEVSKLKQSLEDKAEEIAKLQLQHNLLASLIEELNEKLFSAETSNLLLERQLFKQRTVDQNTLAEMEKKMKLCEEDHNELLLEQRKWNEELADVKTQLTDKVDELSCVYKKHNDLNTSFLELSTELRDLKDIVHQHKLSDVDSEKLISVLENKHQEKDCLVRELCAQLRSSHQHVEAVQSELGDSISEITRKGIIIRDLESHIEVQVKAKEAMENEMSLLKENNRELQMMVDILKEEKQKNDQTLSRNLEKVNTALFEERTKNGKLQKGMREIKTTMHKLMKERQQVEENLSKKAESLHIASAKRKSELEEVTSSLGKCKTTQDNVHTLLATYLSEEKEAKASLQETKEKLEEKLVEFCDTKLHLSQLLEENVVTKSTLESTKEDIQTMQSSSKQSHEMLSALQLMLNGQVEENQSLRKALDELFMSLKRLESIVQTSKEDFQSESEKCLKLSNELKESLQTQHRLQEDVTSVRSQLTQALTLVSENDVKLTQQAAVCEQLNIELNTLSSHHSSHMLQCTLEKENLENSCALVGENLEAEKQKNTHLEKEKLQTMEENSLLRERIESTSLEIEEWKKENSLLKERVESVGIEIEYLKKENGLLKERVESSGLELEELRIENVTDKDLLTEIGNQLKEARCSYEESISKIARLEEELTKTADAMSKLCQLERILLERENEKDELKCCLDQSNLELDELRQQRNIAMASLELCQDKITASEHTIKLLLKEQWSASAESKLLKDELSSMLLIKAALEHQLEEVEATLVLLTKSVESSELENKLALDKLFVEFSVSQQCLSEIKLEQEATQCEVKKLLAERDEVHQQLERCENVKLLLSAELDTAQSLYTQQVERYTQTCQELSQAKTLLEKEIGKSGKLEAELKAKELEYLSLVASKQETNDRLLAEHQDGTKDLIKLCEVKDQELLNLREMNTSYVHQINECQSVIHDLQQEQDNRRDSEEILKVQLQMLENEVNQYRQETGQVELLSNELSALRESYHSQCSMLSKLSTDKYHMELSKIGAEEALTSLVRECLDMVDVFVNILSQESQESSSDIQSLTVSGNAAELDESLPTIAEPLADLETMKTQLKHKFGQLKKGLNTLLSDKAALEKDQKKLISLLDEAIAEREKTESNLQETKSSCDCLREEMLEMSQELQRLQSVLHEKEISAELMSQVKETFRHDVEELKSSLNVLTEQIFLERKEKELLADVLEVCEERNLSLESELSNFKMKSIKEIHHFQKRHNEYERHCQDLETECNLLKQSLNDLKSDLSNLSAHNEELQEHVEILEEEKRNVQLDLESLEKQKDKDVKALSLVLSQAESEHQNLEKECVQLKETLSASESESLKLSAQVELLKQQLDSLGATHEEQLSNLGEELASAKDVNTRLQETLDKTVQEKLEVMQELGLISSEKTLCQDQLSEQNNVVKYLQEIVSEKDVELSSLRTKINELVLALAHKETCIAELQTQVSSLTQSLAEMTQNYETSSDELNKKLVSLQDDYKVQELKMSELQIELISLQQKLLECQDSLQAASLSKSILEETLRTRESDFTESLQNVQRQLEEEVQAKVNILAQNEKEKKELEGKANQLKSDYEHQITELMTELTNARQQAQLANNIVQTMQNSSSQKEQETMNELFSKSEEILVLQRQLEVSLKEQDKVKSDLEASLIEQAKVKSDLEASLIEQGKVKSELEASSIEQDKVKSELEASLIEQDKVKSELKESLMELDKIKSDIVLSEQLYSQTKTELEQHFDQVRDFLHATLGLEECTLNDCWNALASTLTTMIAEKQYLTEQMVDLNHKLSSLEEEKKDGLQRLSEFQAREDEQSENERLCSNLKKRTEEFERLQETFSQLEKQKREVEERYSSLQNEHVKLNDLYSTLQNEHVKLNDSYSSLQNEHVKLNDLYSTLQNEHVKLNDSYSSLQNEHVKLNDSYSTLQNEHVKLNDSYSSLQNEHVKLNDSYSSLQNEHVKLNDLYSSLQNEHVKLNDLYSSLQNEHVKLNDLYSTLQNEHVKLNDSYSTLQNEHVKLNDLYSSLQNEHAKFNEDHQRLQDQLVAIQKLESSPNLSETISQKDSELLTKESHPLTQSEDIQSLTQEMLTKIVTEKDSKITFLLENMQEMEGRLIQLEEQNQSLVERHSSELDQVKQELISKEKAFQDKEMIAKKALATAKKLKFQFTQANKQLEEAKVTIDKLSREKEDQLTLDKSRDAVDSQVKETHTSNDEQTRAETLPELVSQPNESVPTEVMSLQEEVSTYREYCVQLQQQVQSLTDNVFDSDAKVKKYQRDLEQLEGVKEGLKMTVSEVEASYLQLQQELEKAQADHIATKEAMEQRCVILEEQAGQWKSFIKNLEQELQAKDNRIQQMNEELHQLHNVYLENTQFKLSLEGKEEELSSLLSELESKKEVLSKELNTSDQLRTLLSEEQDRLTLSERALEDKNEELSQLRESITQQTTDFELKEQSLLSQISFLDHQIEDHKHQLVEMTALLDKTQLARDQAVSHADNLQKRIDHQQTEISELNQMIDSFRVQELKAGEDKDEELKSLQAALAEFQHQVEDQRVQIDLLVSGDQVNDHNSINSQTIIDNLNQDIHSLKTQQEALESNYDLVLKEKLTLEEEHVRLKSELSGQLDIAKKMQGIVSDKLSQVEHIQSAYEKLESDFNRLSSERDHLVASIDSMRGEIEGLEQMIAESRLSESTAQEKVLKLQLERDQLKLELDKLKAKQALEKETVQHLASEGTQRDDLQRSPSAGKEPPAIASKLRACEAAYEKTKSQLQVAEVKCEKMLVKLKAFKDKNDKLQIQVDELQQQLAGNSPQRDSSLREERRRLEEQVISLNNKLRQIETYNGQLIFENASIKTQLKKEQESEHSYKSDLELSRAQCEALERQIVELKKELSDSALNFNTQIMDLTSKHDEEMAELKKEEELGKAVFSQEMSRLSEALDNSRREAQFAMTAEVAKVKETLNVEISSLQNALEASRSDCAHAEEERNTEQKNVITLKSELSNLKEEISKLNAQLEIAEVKALESETRVLKMKDELLEEERVRQVRVEGQAAVEHTELTSLKSQLETLQLQYTTLSHDNDSYQALVTSLTSSNAALKQECEQLRFKSKDSQSVQETDRLRQLLTEMEQERDELREEFEGVREELVELRREKVSLTQQLSELTTTVQQLTDKIVNLESLRSAQTPLNIEDNVKVERVLPLGQGVNITETEGIESKLSDLKEELSAALKENHQLKATVSGLNWKLEEACNLEQEVEDLQTELSSSNMEKKILSHDLEEVRGEMSALQTDKHLLMKEVERLSEIVDGQDRKGSGDGRPTKVQRSASEEVLQFLAAKDAEISQIQSLLDDQSKQVLTGLKEIELREGIIAEKEEQISKLQKEVLFLQMNLKELELKNSSLTAELKSADRELTKRLEHFNLKLDTVKSLEADFDSLNVDFNTVLEEKRDMAKEIEDLHNKIGQLMTQQQEVTFNQEQQEHVLREKEALQRRVVELETTEGSFLLENARMKQEVDRLRAVLQQAEFVKESLSSHQDSGVGGSLGKVQAQFSEVVEERNRIMIQLNDAEHRLKQREARCQQLAMQVSQLAEDRGYLNSQLANISKSLREKEQEWIAIRQQYGELYQAYIAVQSKTAELERRIALDSVQKELEEEETAAEADQVKGQTDQALKRIEELQSMYSNLEESHSALSTSLIRERTLREQLERELGEAQEQIKLLAAGENREVYLQLEEDNEMRIRETSTMLTRHGMGYCSRVHSWLKVKKDYFSFSSRQLTRVMRLRPGLRTIIWIYFAFIHFLLIGCFSGFL
ncbi:golgin subfamily B member 1-like isoform X2 [Biomphalaria glabrata]|uniref:Golgin subfamily B member 1-like isoform X2 n=1 Tax=Biomphalaria glabrata TaxID=6526 RepID=A0A9W3AM83_BIOGL|nr:golgin subfamily B member 1-like isoform X2 [Biomphalaria glabrata]